MDQNIETNTEH